MRSLVFSALLLAGCATTNPAIKVQFVDRPVVVVEKCVKAEDVPAKPGKLGEAPDNLEDALSLALAKVSEWIRFGDTTEKILEKCV